ncbi:response regulator transcription factor [Parasutterella excrementihominis]|uniref:response regulator transcription factor n=1 Tax=Parasutterella excrementihominis TaxID=487175 RepID=UPI00242F43BA|nr:response regulator [Parasutterella excrementihominis]
MSQHNLHEIMVIRIVDDDEELLTSFRFLLEGEGWFVRTYNSAESFLEKDNFNVPGCAIVDIRMTGMSGLELQDVLNARGIKLPLIFLSGHGTVETVVDTLRSGAVTFLSKSPSLDKLKEAIENALMNAKELDDQKEDFRNWQSLTSKEKEVARLVSEGLLNKQIADELGIAERTVQTHRTMVYRKLDVKNNIEVYKILNKLKVLS